MVQNMEYKFQSFNYFVFLCGFNRQFELTGRRIETELILQNNLTQTY